MMDELVSCPKCGAKNRLGVEGAVKMPRCGKCHQALPWLIHASDADFDLQIRAGIPVLVDFWAPWCGPCKMIAPILEEVARDLAGRLKIVKLDTQDNPQVAARFRIQAIPTLMLFKDGEVIDTIRGAMPRIQLLQRLGAHGV